MSLMEKEQQLSQLQEQLAQCQDDAARRMQLEHEIKEMQEEMYQDLSAWDRVYLARHPRRPKAQDYLKRLFHTFYELHGDRCYGDDRAIIGGIAMFEQTPVTVIAQAKGRDLQENMKRNFGMPNPEDIARHCVWLKRQRSFIVRSSRSWILPVLIRAKARRSAGRLKRSRNACIRSLICRRRSSASSCLRAAAAARWH